MNRYIKPVITDNNASFGIDIMDLNPTVQSDPNSGVDDGLGKQRGEDFSDEAAEKGKGWSEGLW